MIMSVGAKQVPLLRRASDRDGGKLCLLVCELLNMIKLVI
jgi:hypothetical protein